MQVILVNDRWSNIGKLGLVYKELQKYLESTLNTLFFVGGKLDLQHKQYLQKLRKHKDQKLLTLYQMIQPLVKKGEEMRNNKLCYGRKHLKLE